MSTTRFPRRSLLYSPGDRLDLLEKAFETDADTLIFDLEDAVSPERKPEARRNVVDLADEIDATPKEVCVRINGVEVGMVVDDVTAAIEAGVDSIKLPKVEAAWQVRTVLETARSVDPDADLEVGISLETPAGILAGREIVIEAGALPAVTNVNYGNADYVTALGAPGPDEALGDMLRFLTASYASVGGLDPIGSAILELDDPERQRRLAERNRAFGFIGMTAIHPDQVRIINEVFTPPAETVERARMMVERFEATDRDSIVVDGEFLDAPVVERYRRVLARAEAIEGVGRTGS